VYSRAIVIGTYYSLKIPMSLRGRDPDQSVGATN